MAMLGNVILGVGTAVGILFLFGGIGLIFIFENVLDNQIRQQVVLVNNSETFNQWEDPPVPVTMKFYVFDVKNAYEVTRQGAKPVVKQRGPYTYREGRTKGNIRFHDNGTLSYVQPRYFYFDLENSVGPENETFTSVNLPILTVSSLLRFEARAIQDAVGLVVGLAGEELFQTHTVAGFLWGYTIPALKDINEVTKRLLNKTYFDDKFGLFYKPTGNGSNDGVYNVYTGKTDSKKFNQIDRWNGEQYLPYWRNKYCNMINGTDGTMWHPFIQKTDTLYLFSTDICRSVYVTYEKSVRGKGIDLYRFTAPEEVFMDVEHNPDNIGFCTPDCLGSGVLNISQCKIGAPVLVSNPHFYQADKKYIDAVDGISPNKTEHETFVEVEPYTGVSMNAAKKLQINTYIRSSPVIRYSDTLNDVVFPVLWLNEGAEIDDKTAEKFKSMVLFPVNLLHAIQWAVIALGAFIILVCVILIVRKRWTKSSVNEDSVPIVQGDESVNQNHVQFE